MIISNDEIQKRINKKLNKEIENCIYLKLIKNKTKITNTLNKLNLNENYTIVKNEFAFLNGAIEPSFKIEGFKEYSGVYIKKWFDIKIKDFNKIYKIIKN